MMRVGAVGNRGLCGFPSRCGRVLCVHRGGSVHIVFDRAEIFKGVITSGTMRVAKKGDTAVAAPSRKSLLGHPGRFSDRADPRGSRDHAQCARLRPERKRRSNSAGLT